MTEDVSGDILDGIAAYLADEFPGVTFSQENVGLTGSVILHADQRPHYRLEITEQFLDGEGGATIPIQWVRDWNVAQTLRDANGRMVTLTTSGVRVET